MALLLGGRSVTHADRAPTFGRDVRPILAEHCLECHGPDENAREANLSLDSASGLRRVVVPGAPTESELWLRLHASDPDDRMPPPATHDALSEAERSTIERWIEAGATWEPHWSYAPLRAVSPPTGDADHPTDRFVDARLRAALLERSPRADRSTQLRRNPVRRSPDRSGVSVPAQSRGVVKHDRFEPKTNTTRPARRPSNLVLRQPPS